MNNEIKEILDKFDRILGNYELDKKWGELSVDSICHLFPNELITIKDYITNLQGRIDKATSLLKEAGCYDEETKTFCDDVWEELPDLLNILQGENNEPR